MRLVIRASAYRLGSMSYVPNGPRYLHHLAHSTGGSSGLESAGLWLIAFGAFIAIAALLIAGPLAGLSGRPVGRAGTPQDRLVYAVTAAGASLVAIGSVFVAIHAFPAWWVVVVTIIGAALLFWGFAAWRLRADSAKGRDDAQDWIDSGAKLPDGTHPTQPVQRREWDRQRYSRQMTWQWYVFHAFTSDAAAKHSAEDKFGPREKPETDPEDPDQPPD